MESEIKAASIENIIADKLAATQRFKAGNTRIKDFDDLWRISISEISINKKRFKKLLSERNIVPKLDKEWITDEMDVAWAKHRNQYSDLPENLEDIFLNVNRWLAKVSK